MCPNPIIMKNFLETCLPVSFIAVSSEQHLFRLLREHEFYVIELDDDSIVDSESFFRSILTRLPLNPPLWGPAVVWDAFKDSLLGGIDDIADKESHIAIVWKDTEKMMEHDPRGFALAISCFEQIVRNVAIEEYDVGEPVIVRFFMTGNGPKFTPIPQDMP